MAIERFISGHWYIYKGEKLNLWNHNPGEMDFILDRKPHKCNKSSESSPSDASFYDSKSPTYMWSWSRFTLKDFYDITLDFENKLDFL